MTFFPSMRVSLYFSLIIIYLSLFTSLCHAEESLTVIISDRLEYFSREKKYIATGSVVIEQDDAVLRSDEITYYEETSDAVAEGKVRYDDPAFSIKAAKGRLNMEAGTGKLFDAEVFYRRDNYHLKGKEIERRAENNYYSPEASVTTCDLPVPAWCFRGKEIDSVIGERITARDVTFRIRDFPVFYTPYFRASISVERETGFLTPVAGFSRSKGLGLSVPFYWAIAENMDATVFLDIYSKRGLGTGLEYRLVQPDDIKSNWWVYHIRDSGLNKDFLEVIGLHENRQTDKTGWFLNINYVNENDFYREYASHFETRTRRFLESAAEISGTPTPDSRLFLLSQYWVDLKNDTLAVPQRLPEVGYVLNYRNIGDFMFSASLSADNMWREDGASARRLDIYPKLRYSAGTDFVFSQMLAARETLYSFYKKQDVNDYIQRSSLEYDIEAHTRLTRSYESFVHVIEPSLGYHFISSSENNLPVFDRAELFTETSRIEVSILNRAMVKGREFAAVRITQGIETRNGDRPFMPLNLDIGIKGPVDLKTGVTFDVNTGKVETLNSDISVRLTPLNFTVGQTYNRIEDIMMFRTGMAFSPVRSIQMTGQLWYDAKGGGVRDASLTMKYLSQCWSMRAEVVKKPGDFKTLFLFELAGLSSKSSRNKAFDHSSSYL